MRAPVGRKLVLYTVPATLEGRRDCRLLLEALTFDQVNSRLCERGSQPTNCDIFTLHNLNDSTIPNVIEVAARGG
jgi:hypothetical protein